MIRGKPEFKNSVRVSLVLEHEDFECIKKAALHRSNEEGRLITPSEMMRLALKKCYAMSTGSDSKKESSEACQLGSQ